MMNHVCFKLWLAPTLQGKSERDIAFMSKNNWIVTLAAQLNNDLCAIAGSVDVCGSEVTEQFLENPDPRWTVVDHKYGHRQIYLTRK
jgi:hypothetical protein